MEAAVVSASHGAMGSLIGKLGDLLTAKYKLLKQAEGQIMFLKAELESMHVFLKKISDTEEPDEQDKCWAKEVRELSYDIEDSVSEFMLRVEHGSSMPLGFKGFLKRCLKLLTTIKIRHDIAKELEGLKVRVVEVRERRMRYQKQNDDTASRGNMRYQQIDNVASRPNMTTIDRHLLAVYAETSGLVAIEGPRDELIQLMDGEGVPSQQLKVLSIVGFGGLGKTTLANQIFHKLGGQFQCQAFVSVSQKPNIWNILRIILSRVGFPQNTDMAMWEEYELISELRKYLFDKRYFIVIDDIWDTRVWDTIRCALPENMNGSRVITTTRNVTVARACCINRSEYIYEMKLLNEKDSRRLFFKRIFDSEDDCPTNLKEVSADILKKCGGLPLAIKMISSLLASQRNQLEEYWEYVRDSLGSNDFQGSQSLEVMRQILNLSYIDLPNELRTCMLYLGMYPEDYTINKNDLARQWVAGGFISQQVHGKHPEDVAMSYFNELINRSIIQPTDTSYNGEVISCRVHDMMRDLILHKSREENFISVLDDIREIAGHRDKVRRLSLHMDGAIDYRVLGSIQISKLRTLARFTTTSYSSSLSNIPYIIQNFEIPKGSGSSYLPDFRLLKHLQVLTIEIGRSPSSVLLDFTGIQHMFQLRHLSITADIDPVLLPRKIGGLQQLETFKLRTPVVWQSNKGKSFEELPSDIVQLNRLLHLHVPMWRRLPVGIGNMKSLRTLRGFNLISMNSDIIKGLRELTNLTDLVIGSYTGIFTTVDHNKVAERGREVLRACLEKLCNLKYLDIGTNNFDACLDVPTSVPASFYHLQRFRASYHTWFSRVPGWIDRLHNLYDLVLEVEEVLEDDVGMLAQLPSLINLQLCIRQAPKDKIIIRGSGFPVLKHFIVSCCRISYLNFEARAMPKLESLVLRFNAPGWDRHGAAPAGIEHLSGLKEISAQIGGSRARESNRRAAESALRNAIDIHPGRPAANIKCIDNMTVPFYDRENYECDEQTEDASCST